MPSKSLKFNQNGLYIGDKHQFENLVDELKKASFIRMKSLVASNLDSDSAFKNIAKHNICAVTIGMVSIDETKISTTKALEYLKRK